jgi:hypothetical protein
VLCEGVVVKFSTVYGDRGKLKIRRSDGAPIGAVRLQLLLLERLKFLPSQRAVVEQPLQLSQPCEVHHDAGRTRWTAEFTRGAILFDKAVMRVWLLVLRTFPERGEEDSADLIFF